MKEGYNVYFSKKRIICFISIFLIVVIVSCISIILRNGGILGDEKNCTEIFKENKDLFIKVRDDLYDHLSNRFDQTFQASIKLYQNWKNDLTLEIHPENKNSSEYIYEDIDDNSVLAEELKKLNETAGVREIMIGLFSEDSRYNTSYKIIKFALNIASDESIISRGLVTSTISVDDLYYPIESENDWYMYTNYAV